MPRLEAECGLAGSVAAGRLVVPPEDGSGGGGAGRRALALTLIQTLTLTLTLTLALTRTWPRQGAHRSEGSSRRRRRRGCAACLARLRDRVRLRARLRGRLRGRVRGAQRAGVGLRVGSGVRSVPGSWRGLGLPGHQMGASPCVGVAAGMASRRTARLARDGAAWLRLGY